MVHQRPCQSAMESVFVAAQGSKDMQDDTLRIDRSAKTLRTLALERMREAIMDFHFQPGERLVERPLCDQLGVSRSVVHRFRLSRKPITPGRAFASESGTKQSAAA